MLPPDEQGKKAIARVRRYAEEAGRSPDAVGLEGRVTVAGGGPEDWAGELKAWSELGATHISVNTGGAGFTNPDQHIDAIRRVKEVIGG
jgi:alkanesulfonate monooxygenase SsuD/methylene tetrahydromethanopterin reductase-like flavin-dependent oxidoreductase (luciferase family)